MTHHSIVAIVAKEFHVLQEDILNPRSMKHGVCDARNVTVYIIRLKDQQHTQKEIALFLNKTGSPYSFFRHARTRVNNLLKTDKEFKLRVELCMLLINKINKTDKAIKAITY